MLRFRQFDTVQIEGVHLMEYLPIIQKAPGSPAIVVDWHNIESEMMWRYSRTTAQLGEENRGEADGEIDRARRGPIA